MEEAMIEITPLNVTREFNGAAYKLNSVQYDEEAAKIQAAWLKERGSKTRIVKDGRYWLVYSKVGG